MPELPEVEHICRYLRERVAGRAIVGVVFADARTRAAAGAAEGARIEGVRRRGKLVLLPLAGGRTLVFHLMLTGKLFVRERGAPLAKGVRLALALEGGKELQFEDARRFGWAAVAGAERLAAIVGDLGPEPLEEGFTLARFRERLAGRRGGLKPILLDQTFVAGIGNIYADEALFAARLHPLRRAEGLSAAEVRRLHGAVRGVLSRALAEREAIAVPDQERVGGGSRSAARRIARAVFQRTGEPCVRCGGAIARIVVAGRGTHLCPRCQRAPMPAEP